MSTAYLSEIRIMAFNFAPRGWAMCNGQILSIQQNTALFALIGTTYGGNGVNTFALPNLQGSVPTSMGTGFTIGQIGGEAGHTLTINEIPQHTHQMVVDATGATATHIPAGNTVLSKSLTSGGADLFMWGPQGAFSLGALAQQSMSMSGSSGPHENQQPYLTLTFCIALQGIFPSRN